MKALGWWLMLVGLLRLASVWFGFFDIWALQLAVFSNTTMWGTSLYEVKFVPESPGMSTEFDGGTSIAKSCKCTIKKIESNCRSVLTEVHGRTFGVWTLLTCTLCFLCAFNLENKPLYLATFLSFIYAFGHFLTEYLIYHTMEIANLTTVGVFAGTSIIWMLLQWNAHQRIHVKHS